jgi:hypothetical protein
MDVEQGQRSYLKKMCKMMQQRVRITLANCRLEGCHTLAAVLFAAGQAATALATATAFATATAAATAIRPLATVLAGCKKTIYGQMSDHDAHP